MESLDDFAKKYDSEVINYMNFFDISEKMTTEEDGI